MSAVDYRLKSGERARMAGSDITAQQHGILSAETLHHALAALALAHVAPEWQPHMCGYRLAEFPMLTLTEAQASELRAQCAAALEVVEADEEWSLGRSRAYDLHRGAGRLPSLRERIIHVLAKHGPLLAAGTPWRGEKPAEGVTMRLEAQHPSDIPAARRANGSVPPPPRMTLPSLAALTALALARWGRSLAATYSPDVAMWCVPIEPVPADVWLRAWQLWTVSDRRMAYNASTVEANGKVVAHAAGHGVRHRITLSSGRILDARAVGTSSDEIAVLDGEMSAAIRNISRKTLRPWSDVVTGLIEAGLGMRAREKRLATAEDDTPISLDDVTTSRDTHLQKVLASRRARHLDPFAAILGGSDDD